MFDSSEDPTLEIPAEDLRSPLIACASKNPIPPSKSHNFNSLFFSPSTLRPKSLIQNPINQEEKTQQTTDKYEFIELGDIESTYEESLNQCHGYRKTWETFGRELYKVTEFNESMECSILEEHSDLGNKINDFSIKITSSITDKFPKFSVASLSMSEASYQNAFDLYKKSYLDYAEPLEIINYTSPEHTEIDSATKGRGDSPILLSTSAPTLGESNFKTSLEGRSEYCSCPKCGIF